MEQLAATQNLQAETSLHLPAAPIADTSEQAYKLRADTEMAQNSFHLLSSQNNLFHMKPFIVVIAVCVVQSFGCHVELPEMPKVMFGITAGGLPNESTSGEPPAKHLDILRRGGNDVLPLICGPDLQQQAIAIKEQITTLRHRDSGIIFEKPDDRCEHASCTAVWAADLTEIHIDGMACVSPAIATCRCAAGYHVLIGQN